MSCICGRRHYVVLMTFLGMLISIGSREVFTMVITHVLGRETNSEGLLNLHCMNISTEYLHKDWPDGNVFAFQAVYFAGYIVTQLPGGILSAKFSAKRVTGACILISSVLTVALSFGIRYYNQQWLVFFIRVLQGIIEGPVIPAFNGVIAAWAPKSEKSVLITISYAGAYLSAGVAAITAGMMICKVPDPGLILIVYGGVGILWSLVWFVTIQDSPSECKNLSEREKEVFNKDSNHSRPGANVQFSEIPWRKIFTSLPLSAIFVAAFCRNWIFALLLTQLPQYYKDVYDMTPGAIGVWSALPHIMMTVVVISGGFAVDAIIKYRIVSTTVARKAAETIGFGTESVCLLILGLDNNLTSSSQAVAVICVGVAVSGIAISGYQANPLDIAPRYCSVLTGIIRLGTIAAVISTVLATKLVGTSHNTKDWQIIFIISGSIHLAGVVYYLLFASGNRQPWAEVEETLMINGNQELPQPVSESYNSINSSDEKSALLSESLRSEKRLQPDKESLLTKSLRVDRFADESDEFEGPSWFLSTI